MFDFLRLNDLRKLLGWISLPFRTISSAGRGLGVTASATAVMSGLSSVAGSVAMANITGTAPQVVLVGLD